MFRQKLDAAAARSRSLVCVGLDVDQRLAPPALTAKPDWVERFVLGLVEATADLVCAFKPNLAFYEALGPDGWSILRSIIRQAPRDVVWLGDCKRGDIGSTAEAYARAMFEVLDLDAVTINPYLGWDSMEPFLRYADRGSFVLCKTSNAGSGDFQDLAVEWRGDRRPLYEVVAIQAAERGHQNVGLVVGATYPSQLADVRALCPDAPILVPGVGSQGGDIEAAVRAGLDARGAGILVNSSRGICYASRGDDWQQAARDAAQRLRDQIELARGLATNAAR
jgi:orotidine-5'-phosphate decarboxylase